jgi:hypothetical protein
LEIPAVPIVAIAYGGLVAVLAWQAGRGQSLIRPDAGTLVALATVVLPTALAATALIVVARRQPRPGPAPAAGTT